MAKAEKKRSSPALRKVPAVSRAVAILRLLGRSDIPLGVQVIAKTLGLVPSTCLHILRILVAEQLVALDASTKRYTLAAGTVALARTALQKHTFARLVQPDLDHLSERYGVTAIGVEALGLDTMLVVALSRTNAFLRIHVDIGSRFPLLISATGRCVAAFGNFSPKEIEKRFHKLRWENPPSFAEWWDEVAAVREAGYAVDDGRYIAGIVIIAAPVFKPDGTVNTIVVLGVREHLMRIGIEVLGKELCERAARISKTLAGTG